MRTPCESDGLPEKPFEQEHRLSARHEAESSLSAIDDLLAAYAREEEEEDARARAVLTDRRRFVHAAACAFERIVQPAFGSIADRLRGHGGDGLIQERPAVGSHGQRLTLWMSIEGPIVILPRVDRNPYIQLDVNVSSQDVGVWEGDIWNKVGASRNAHPISLEDLTTENVIKRAVGVLHRAVAHGGTVRLEEQ